jgi:hypothetical protein
MHIAADFVFKRLDEAQTGELVLMPFGGGDALAMVLPVLNNGKNQYGVVTAPKGFGERPFHSIFAAEGRCLSFGLDWELQLVRTVEPFGNTNLAGVPGVVQVTDTATVMHFSKPPGVPGAGPLAFDLRAWVRTTTDLGYATTITKWKIWSARAMSLNTMAQPIASFDLATGTQAMMHESC